MFSMLEDSTCRVGDQLSYKRICWYPKYILSLESLGISNTPFADLDTCMLALCRLVANFVVLIAFRPLGLVFKAELNAKE